MELCIITPIIRSGQVVWLLIVPLTIVFSNLFFGEEVRKMQQVGFLFCMVGTIIEMRWGREIKINEDFHDEDRGFLPEDGDDYPFPDEYLYQFTYPRRG